MAGLTPRESRLVNKIAAGVPKGKAGRLAGFSAKTSSQIVYQKLQKPSIQTALQKALAKAGLSDARLAKKHIELLDAKKTISCVSGKEAGAGSVDFVDVDDYQVQVKALDMGYKLKGAYIEKVEMEHKGDVSLSVIDFSSMVKKK